MQGPHSSQQCFQYLSEFQKWLDAVQTTYQQPLKNSNNICDDVNSYNLENFKLDLLFDKVQ